MHSVHALKELVPSTRGLYSSGVLTFQLPSTRGLNSSGVLNFQVPLASSA